MRPIVGLLALALAIGCQPPALNVGLAPVPPPAQIEATREAQSRVLPIPIATVFPRVVGVLLDLGYQVRFANRDLGQVNIFKTWQDGTWSDTPRYSMEATLFFQPEGPGATRVRAAATGRREQVLGESYSLSVSEPQALAPDQCQRLLEILEQRLVPAPPGQP